MRKLSLAMTGIAIAALVTMVSCRKPVNGIVTPGEARTVTFTASTESHDGSKTAVSDHDILWKEGDVISVNGEEFTLDPDADGKTSGSFTGIISSGVPYYVGYPKATTKYTASPLSFSVGIPSTWTYDKYNIVVPMAAYSTTEDLQFYNAVNVLKLNLDGDDSPASKLTSIVLTHATANLNGDIAVTFDGSGNPTFEYATGSKTTIVNFSGDDGQLKLEETKSIYIVLPRIESGDIEITFICANGKYMQKTLTCQPGFDEVNHLITNIEALTVEATENLFVPGDFSIGDGKKISFARGNLFYDGEFKIEENQWDYTLLDLNLEDNNGRIDPNHICHFKWSKNQSEALSVFTDYYYDIENMIFSYGDVLFTNDPDDETKANSSFTVNEGGTQMTGVWRVLTVDEWNYLVGFDPIQNQQTTEYGRKNAMSLCKFVTLTLSDETTLNGIVILPNDESDSPASIPSEIDEEYLESYNAVFLPALGYGSIAETYVNYVTDINSMGLYMSSTCAEDKGEDDYEYLHWTFFCYLDNPLPVITDLDYKFWRYSIRLVRDVK